jgi:AhpD family alkylhydroperoxidase
MNAPLDPFAVAPSSMKAWSELSAAIDSGLEPGLAELVQIRASQINRCAHCINWHASAAREHGETEQRIYLLSAWGEAPIFNDRERAALAWTEALTRISEDNIDPGGRQSLAAHFTDEEQVKLTLMINIVNGWNRLAVGFGRWSDPAAARSRSRSVGR